MATALVHKGDTLRVLPGGKMPVDGVVVVGSTHVDESMLTGGSLVGIHMSFKGERFR